MRIIVTGALGQLGVDVVQRLHELEHTPIATDIMDLDITQKDDVLSFFSNNPADAVIHCAAYTAVDRAEEEPDAAWRVNVLGTRNVAEAAEQHGMKMLYVSTDYVYPGTGDQPQRESVTPSPCNVYGKTKLEGEREAAVCSRLFIVRTSWVFGLYGRNFVETMLKLSETHDTLRVVSDQIGSPTYTVDLAVLLCSMIETERYGTYNASNEGYCSWYSFAKTIFELTGRSVEVIPVSTEAYGAKAVRPKNSRMSKKKLVLYGFTPLPRWHDALKRYLKELNDYKMH